MNNKSSRVFVVFAVLSAFTSILEGFYYYSQQDYLFYGRLLLVLFNTVKAFFAYPKIDIAAALSAIDYTSPYSVVLGYAYSTSLVIAPLCTASVIFQYFEIAFFGLSNSLRISGRPGYIIIGDGEYVDRLAENARKKYRVTIVTGEDISRETMLKYLKHQIRVEASGFVSLENKLDDLKAWKAACIAVNMKESMGNFDAGVKCLNYFDGHLDKVQEPVNLILIGTEDPYLSLLKFHYSSHCRSLDKYSSSVKMRMIDKNIINIRGFVRGSACFARILEQENPHIMIAGLGQFGRTLLSELIVYGWNTGHSMTIDIFERSSATVLTRLASGSSAKDIIVKSGAVKDLSTDDIFRYSITNASGGVTDVSFFSMDTKHIDFRTLAKQRDTDAPFDCAFITFDSLKESVECVSMLGHILSGSCEYVVRVSEKGQRFLPGNNSEYRGIHLIRNDCIAITPDQLSTIAPLGKEDIEAYRDNF